MNNKIYPIGLCEDSMKQHKQELGTVNDRYLVKVQTPRVNNYNNK